MERANRHRAAVRKMTQLIEAGGVSDKEGLCNQCVTVLCNTCVPKKKKKKCMHHSHTIGLTGDTQRH